MFHVICMRSDGTMFGYDCADYFIACDIADECVNSGRAINGEVLDNDNICVHWGCVDYPAVRAQQLLCQKI